VIGQHARPTVNHLVQSDGFRCRRANRCIDRERTVDEAAGFFLGWVGAPTAVDDGICDTCARHAYAAVDYLVRDVAELGSAIAPTMAVASRDTTVTDGTSQLEAPLPLRTGPHALRTLIAQVCLDWCLILNIPGAAMFAEMATTHLHEMIDRLTSGLQTGWPELLAHPAVDMPLRSATPDPLDGLRVDDMPRRERYTAERRAGDDTDTAREAWLRACVEARDAGRPVPAGPAKVAPAAHDLVTWSGSYWYRPDGATAALTLLRLHEHAERITGTGIRQDPEPVPCPGCRRRGLIRRHHARTVECSLCLDVRLTDDQYDRYLRTGRWAKEIEK
jgi:hypothetical protein